MRTKIVLIVSVALLFIGATLLLWQLRIAIQSEISYLVDDKTQDYEIALNDNPNTEVKDNIIFLNPQFGLAIPKINANANVIAQVDPFDIDQYNNALEKGVAHAKGTVLPNQNGNVFLFAHSAENFYETSKYNIYFYLLNKLKKDDDIYVSFNNVIYEYKVEEVKTVNRNDIEYMTNYKDYNTLTLMTCWPAGIDYSRLIVVARQIKH